MRHFSVTINRGHPYIVGAFNRTELLNECNRVAHRVYRIPDGVKFQTGNPLYQTEPQVLLGKHEDRLYHFRIHEVTIM